MSGNWRILVILLLLVGITATLILNTGCETDTTDVDNQFARPVIVATIFPLADITQNIAGDSIEVYTLLPAGVSPHTFDPAPRHMEKVAGAAAIVSIGSGLDDWVEKLVVNAGVNAHLLPVTKEMELRQADHSHAGCSHGEANADIHEQNTVGTDPHVWLDPVLVKEEIAPQIATLLEELFPEDQAQFQNNLQEYQEELDQLHAELQSRTTELENRGFIAYHSAWGYFSSRYGLEELATVEESPGKEPSPAWIADVVNIAREHGTDVIFAEPQFSSKAAEVIAEEYGARVLLMDPLGGESLTGRDSYINLLRYNMDVLEDGLGG